MPWEMPRSVTHFGGGGATAGTLDLDLFLAMAISPSVRAAHARD